MKDVRQLSNFDPKSEPFKATLRDLRRIIRDEIEKLLTRLFYSPGFSALYRDYTGKLDFKAFQQKLLQGLEAERAKVERGDESSLPFVFRAVSEIVSETKSPELHKFNSQQENKDVFGQVYHLIVSLDYSPPTEWKDLFTHLACLFTSWDLHSRNPSLHEDFSPFSDMILLLSFAKLMGASYELLAKYTMKGKRELDRTKESTKSHKKRVEEDAHLVKKTFSGLQFPKEAFPNGVSFHKVAGMIEIILKSKITDPFSIDKIKRILKNDEMIWRQFKEMKVTVADILNSLWGPFGSLSTPGHTQTPFPVSGVPIAIKSFLRL